MTNSFQAPVGPPVSPAVSPRALLAIAGPTASGKSALALRLAREICNSEIVSIDSLQVYRGFEVASGKPTVEERGQVRHHLIDIFSPDQETSAGLFLKVAKETINSLLERKVSPIVVVGTTMYWSLLLHGLAELPPKALHIRAELEPLPNEELWEKLRQLDPLKASNLHPNDKVRVVRALETVLSGNLKTSTAHRQHGYSEECFRALMIVLIWPRAALYERINARSLEFVRSGLVAETAALQAQYGSTLHGLRALGYAQAAAVLRGDSSPKQGPAEELALQIAIATRRFGKRQLTYWRGEPLKRGWKVVPSQEGVLSITSKKGKEFSVLSLSWQELLSKIQRRIEEPDLQREVWYVDAGYLMGTM